MALIKFGKLLRALREPPEAKRELLQIVRVIAGVACIELR